jgi:hypothetical protein
MDIIQRRDSANTVLEPFVVNSSVFKGYNPANVDELPLLFYTGYLTVKQKELINGRAQYTLGAVWEQPGMTVVAEVKYSAKKTIDALLNAALKQIHDRRYYNKYPGKVLLLGIAFAGQPGWS